MTHCDNVCPMTPSDPARLRGHQWELVCDRAWQPRSAQSAFMLGLVVSALLSGPLSDRFGRLRLVCIMSAASLLTVVTQGLAGSVELYIVARSVTCAL